VNVAAMRPRAADGYRVELLLRRRQAFGQQILRKLFVTHLNGSPYGREPLVRRHAVGTKLLNRAKVLAGKQTAVLS
jgi:hypothetical protein